MKHFSTKRFTNSSTYLESEWNIVEDEIYKAINYEKYSISDKKQLEYSTQRIISVFINGSLSKGQIIVNLFDLIYSIEKMITYFDPENLVYFILKLNENINYVGTTNDMDTSKFIKDTYNIDIYKLSNNELLELYINLKPHYNKDYIKSDIVWIMIRSILYPYLKDKNIGIQVIKVSLEN